MLLLDLYSFVQPTEQMRSMQEHLFIKLRQRKALAEQETGEQRRGPKMLCTDSSAYKSFDTYCFHTYNQW